MKRTMIALITMALLPLSALSAAHSAELNIEFKEPERFSDIEPARENRTRFRERTLAGFEEIFAQVASRLPEDQVLNVTVTDIDLAGYVEPIPSSGGLEPLRIVRHGHEPVLRFEYSLVAADGEVLQEGEERLRGRTTTDTIRRHSTSTDNLGHEREMVERWFRENFNA